MRNLVLFGAVLGPVVLGQVSANVFLEDKEVCVIGGGAAGSFTSWELQKRGYNTLLIEPRGELGGNCGIVKLDGDDYVNAAVILFTQTPEVIAFFEEFGASYSPFMSPQDEVQFLFSLLGALGDQNVIPRPPSGPADQLAIAAGLMEYVTVTSQPPYLVNGQPPDVLGVPDFSSLDPATRDALMAPFGQFLAENHLVQAVAPIINSFTQGLGYLPELFVWEVLFAANARLIAQLFSPVGPFQPFIELDNGCQELYDNVQDALLENDDSSLLLSTKVLRFNHKEDGRVMLHLEDMNSGSKNKIYCDKVIIAFRTVDMDQKFASGFSKAERDYFGDIDYSGYLSTTWNMQTGPRIKNLGVDLDAPLSFINIADGTSIVDVGIQSLLRDGPDPNRPYRVFYQLESPFKTDTEKQAAFDQVESDLEAIGFVDIESNTFSQHLFYARPQTSSKLETFYGFMSNINFGQEPQSIYYTGAMLAGEGTEYVYRYSKRLLDARFPEKSTEEV